MSPRILPLLESEWDDEIRALLESTGLGEKAKSDILTTLVRHRRLFRRWVPFSGAVIHGRLAPRQRELLILRTAWDCRCEFEWGHHVLFGRDAGLSDDEIERVAAGPSHTDWEAADAALLAAVDELRADACITDETWQTLAEHLDEVQLIEVLFVVGNFEMLAYAINNTGVVSPPDLPRFPPRSSGDA